MVECFSTARISSSERLAQWHHRLRHAFDDESLTLVPRDGTLYGGTFTGWRQGACDVRRVTSTPVTVRSERSEISGSDPERAILVVQERGTAEPQQAGKLVRLNQGDLTLHVAPQPWSIHCVTAARLVGFALPYDRLAVRIGDPRRHVGTHVDAKRGAFIAAFVRALADHDHVIDDDGWSDAVIDVMLDLMVLTYCSRSAQPARTELGEQWQRTVRAFVERHLSDPELGSTLIARRLGVTPRYVQMVFAGMATTASKYILGRRLKLAVRLLAQPSITVADVALQVGFSDVSYFHRCFRRRFGVSPSAYRAR